MWWNSWTGWQPTGKSSSEEVSPCLSERQRLSEDGANSYSCRCCWCIQVNGPRQASVFHWKWKSVFIRNYKIKRWSCKWLKECTVFLSESRNQSTKLTATRMHHRALTYYVQPDVSEKERSAFYSHVGHSKAINESVHQCLPSLLEVTKVGQYLQDLHTGNVTATPAGLVICYHLDCLS